MLLRIYGKIIISWEAQIGFLSLVPNHILMPLLICKLLIIVIQGVFSSRGKLQRWFSFTLNYFDIYCLAGSTALLLFLHSSYLFSSYVHYFYYNITVLPSLPISSASPSPFYGIRATLFWPVVVLLCLCFLSMSTQTLDIPLLCSLLIIVGATLVVK